MDKLEEPVRVYLAALETLGGIFLLSPTSWLDLASAFRPPIM